jgi:hypothetical protein
MALNAPVDQTACVRRQGGDASGALGRQQTPPRIVSASRWLGGRIAAACPPLFMHPKPRPCRRIGGPAWQARRTVTAPAGARTAEACTVRISTPAAQWRGRPPRRAADQTPHVFTIRLRSTFLVCASTGLHSTAPATRRSCNGSKPFFATINTL